jgi:carboxyl-terminal processing protease
VSELIDRVRGEPGTTVTLDLERADGSRREVDIERAEVTIPPVTWSMVPGTTVADIGINQFSDGAARETRRALRRALADGATAVVLDLRGNPGGLVNEAIDVAGLFLPQGSTVYQEEHRAGDRIDVTTRDEPVAPDVPLVVLVDEGSASAAEIVASALHDDGRARVVGARTFGTGTVLNFFPLSDGSAIRLGVVRWLTPEGASLFETGVGPDVVVDLRPTGAVLYPEALDGMAARDFRRSDDGQLRRAVRLLTTDPEGTPRPAPTPTADAPAPTDAAPTPSASSSEAPPSPLEAKG